MAETHVRTREELVAASGLLVVAHGRYEARRVPFAASSRRRRPADRAVVVLARGRGLDRAARPARVGASHPTSASGSRGDRPRARDRPRAHAVERARVCSSRASAVSTTWRRRGGMRALPRLRREPSVAPPTTAPEVVHEVLDAPGEQLDDATRDEMESRFGYDFGSVRVHSDERAAQSAEAVEAAAWTVGDDVAFARGLYQPHSSAGRELLAHELAHVVEGEDARTDSTVTLGRTGDPAERRADARASGPQLGPAAISSRPRAGTPRPRRRVAPHDVRRAPRRRDRRRSAGRSSAGCSAARSARSSAASSASSPARSSARSRRRRAGRSPSPRSTTRRTSTSTASTTARSRSRATASSPSARRARSATRSTSSPTGATSRATRSS